MRNETSIVRQQLHGRNGTERDNLPFRLRKTEAQ